MKLEDIFTSDELASIDAGTYDITRPLMAAKLDLWAALEREACAKVCENHYDEKRVDFTRSAYITTLQCAAAIRARGEKPC